MKTKPFDLKAALAGAKVVTKGGIPVTEISANAYGCTYAIQGTVEGAWRTWTKLGDYCQGCPSDMDLLLVDGSVSGLLPFNLEAALKGEMVVTRRGLPVTQIVRFTGTTSPVYGIVGGLVKCWHESGEFFCGGVHACDLFMAAPEPKMRVFWVNLYPDNISYIYSSESAADNSSGLLRIGKARRVEIEE